MQQVDWHSYAVHNEAQIRGFFGDYRFLSNFHEQQVVYLGQVFPTNEHAFQAQKYPRERRYSCLGMTPSQVRRWGREAPLSPEQLQEWEANKLTIMLEINRSKFRNKELQKLLLATGSRYLEETNHWSDRFWGCHYVRGSSATSQR